MIVMGSLYLHDCPQGEYIPVYLLVGGIFGVLKQLLHLSVRVRQREEERTEERLRQSPTQLLLNCFMLGWFIIGTYYGFLKLIFFNLNIYFSFLFIYYFCRFGLGVQRVRTKLRSGKGQREILQ